MDEKNVNEKRLLQLKRRNNLNNTIIIIKGYLINLGTLLLLLSSNIPSNKNSNINSIIKSIIYYLTLFRFSNC